MKIKREFLYAPLFLVLAIGLLIAYVIFGLAPNRIVNSIHDWYTKRGVDVAEYLTGMQERAGIIYEAYERNGTLMGFFLQAPELIDDPAANVMWRQNAIIIQVEADYWRHEMPPSGYAQFHFSAVHTANMCYDLVQFISDLLWPPEGYNQPEAALASAMIEQYNTACFDGLAAIFAIVDPQGTQGG